MFEPVLDRGEAREVVDYWAQSWQRHYVYVLLSMSKGEPFYVGKGSRYRFDDHIQPYHINNNWDKWKIIKEQGGYLVMFDLFCMFEEDALAREIEVIEFYRQEGVQLTNLTDGGEGGFTPEQRERAVRNSTATNRTPAQVARLTAQGRRAAQMDHVRQARRDGINRMHHVPRFVAARNAAIRERFLLRHKALDLLQGQPLPPGVVMPVNLWTGGTLKFWRDLVRTLENDDALRD